MQQQNPMMGQRMGTPQTQAGPTKPVTQPIILGKDQQMLTDIRYETLSRVDGWYECFDGNKIRQQDPKRKG